MSNPRRQAEAIIEQYDAEARDILRHTRIDLAGFLALKGEARAARWRMLDAAAKDDLVIQELRANGIEWTPELVAIHVAKLNARWGAAPQSDMAIPSATDIADAAKEQADLARQHGDHVGAGQLDRVRLNVLKGARMAWHLGELLIASLNTPGAVYCVSRRGCSCPNGRAGKSSCWHVAAYDLLVQMQQDRADTADMQAERAQLRDRIVACRANSAYAA